MEPPCVRVLALVINIAFSSSVSGIGFDVRKASLHSPHKLSQLALAIARASYLPTDGNRFIQNGSIMENPVLFDRSWVKCPKNRPEMDAGLCYKPCKRPASWAFSKGVGPVCWGCPNSHPVEQGGLCYRKCPGSRPHGRIFLCFGDCPAGYRNHGLTCFRDLRIRGADISRCPWYDKCGLTFSRGCSKCPPGYRNDGCTCRRNPHLVVRPRLHRGVGVVMRSYGRGIGRLPSIFAYDPVSERAACRVRDWVGQAYVKEDTEVIKFTSDRQKIVAFGFRGTDPTSIRDWLANFNFLPQDFWLNGTQLTTHAGFKDKYDKIASWFEKEYSSVPSGYTILLTGHSLGGAEAYIAAAFAAGKLGRAPDAVITWGSPLTGAENFKNFYRKVVGCHVTVNYVTKSDMVARMPRIFGYTHVCDSVQLDPGAKGLVRVHDLFTGYGKGLERKYGNSTEIKIGCDVLVEKDEEPESLLGFFL